MRLPTKDEIFERRFRLVFWTIAGILILIAVACVYGVIVALGLRPAEGAEVQAVYGARMPGFHVEDEHGAIDEPAEAIVTRIDGQSTIRLKGLVDPSRSILAPVEALKLVSPYAKRTKWGNCVGVRALVVGRQKPRNTVYYRPGNIACAAYTAAIHRHCGHGGLSFSASAQYAQLRKRGWKIVASKVSTRYLPYLKYYKAGDQAFFWKSSSRIGHTELYVGNGMTSGTSSSQGRVAIRHIGNRGFRLVSILRG